MASGGDRVSGIDLAGAVGELVDELRAAGIGAAADLRDLNPPAVLVPPPSIEWRFGRGAALEWRIVAAAPNTGTGPATVVLSRLVDAVQTALRGRVTGGRPVDLTSPDGGAPLPGYELTMSTKRPERNTSMTTTTPDPPDDDKSTPAAVEVDGVRIEGERVDDAPADKTTADDPAAVDDDTTKEETP